MQKWAMLYLTAMACTGSSASFAPEKSPAVALDLASTFPGSMPILGDAAHHLAERVKRATGTTSLQSAEALITAADAARYRAKHNGRDRVEVFAGKIRRKACAPKA